MRDLASDLNNLRKEASREVEAGFQRNSKAEQPCVIQMHAKRSSRSVL
ncbi:hypothetical protein PI124_g4304 [Phytophthora idaei]|nr:hypothetical protein PI125_g4154 [Phytophthora idaei]KAG3159473.1 hypothetical protein PI126_g7369 [Phytophthora idaei]KAG3251044.1 hypothetical protein PI124_g4304 [Phytophthora idaei]